MATLAGHWTKLQAVNRILDSIGEDPVNSLSSGLPEAELAETFLEDSSRRIQLLGWHVNTRRGVKLTQNASDQFALPDDTLKVDSVNPYGYRQGTKVGTKHVNVSMRRSADDTKWLLYDVDKDSETWTDGGVSTLYVDLVQLKEFANLTPALQMYIFTSAAHRFQKSVMGSNVLHEYTKEDVNLAELNATNEDLENEDLNMLRDNPTSNAIAYRHNPMWGT